MAPAPPGMRPGGPMAPDNGNGRGASNLPVPVAAASRGGGVQPRTAQAPAARKKSRLSLSNWRVRWRLIAIIAVPTVTAMILGSVQIANAISNYSTFNRVRHLADLNQAVVNLSGSMANERDVIAGYIANHGMGLDGVRAQEKQTDQAKAAVQNMATGVTVAAGYNAGVVQALDNGVLAGINDLNNIRDAALGTHFPAPAIILRYGLLLQAMDTFSAGIANGTGNVTLQNFVTEQSALLRVEADASQERAILYQGLAHSPPQLLPADLSSLTTQQQQEAADENQFSSVASVQESQLFENTVSGSQVDEARAQEELAITQSTAGENLNILSAGIPADCAANNAGEPATCWFYTQGVALDKMRAVSNGLVANIISQANTLRSNALKTATIVSALTLFLLILVLIITTFVARSMIRPLRKLRSDALEVAGSKLPEMVRRLSESEGGEEGLEIEPIGVTSTDEIGEVARAFDQVHREAVRLAADEAMLRGNLNAMFVNLSRRSQSLIERQLSLIDNLEQSEQDSGRLSSLFRLDHLATRMRRNSENLLVLAGHEASRRWSQPVPLVDVLRAAISEIEQYERVVLNVQPGIVVVGQAVNDVVHLVAEVVENATTFSPEDTQVYVTGQPLSSGGVLLDITDNGVGISESEMAHANWRLDNPPVVDVAVSRRMGLFVVGRLAARHGVRVRLRHAQSGGLTALIWLPDAVAAPEGAPPLGRLRKFEAEDYGPAPSLSAPPATATAPGFGQPFVSPAGAMGTGPMGMGTGGTGPTGTNAGSMGGGPAAASEAAAAAAAASRIPRFSGGPGPQDSSAAAQPPLPTRPVAPPRPTNGSEGSVPGTGNGFGVGPASTETPAAQTSRLPSFADGRGNGSGQAGNGLNGGGTDSVTIPPAASASRDQRLPIFDSLESDWFRRSGKTMSSGSADKPVAQTWSSPADEGWRAASVVASPNAGETTTAGLPKRVPRANLVPGSVGGGAAGPEGGATPSRSAEDVRSRMSSFQRGVREARATGPQIEES
jgi:signal transduction histidine kinase